ncbi:MAG: hypothetical protein MUC55_13705, partial [Burkholderiales bacterium]|nr:hypothetical protein [Burkholderiales bacterium]
SELRKLSAAAGAKIRARRAPPGVTISAEAHLSELRKLSAAAGARIRARRAPPGVTRFVPTQPLPGPAAT